MYTYDNNNRITKVVDSVAGTTEYTYDAQGQLLTETQDGVTVNTMTYGTFGNITEKNGVVYSYHGVWKDKLISYGNREIVYDEQGNPTNYLGHSLTWEKGRQLKSCGNTAYTYNKDGIRTGKTVNGVAHTYLLEGSVILQETWSGNCLMPMYDSMGEVCGIVHNSAGYYFRKNLQGDVIAIVDSTLTTVAEYTYDAWGKILKITDENGCDITDPNGYACCVEFPNAEHIAHINPFRYRSYYYDTETELYYLQSRYYDPETGRFLNADDVNYLDPEDLSAINLYAYCGNNPVDKFDPTGHAWDTVLDVISIGWSIYDLLDNPSWENAGWLALDIVFAIVPFLTSSRIIKAASKLDEVAYVGQSINRLDNMYDTVVLGNDMNRVMDRAWDIGATFYGGYGPLNALNALHDCSSATDVMKYAAKLDNARFIIDKVNDGYKFVHIGSDGRSFFKMMKSAYGMELKILYRLKFGNKLHKAWWVLNFCRRLYD